MFCWIVLLSGNQVDWGWRRAIGLSLWSGSARLAHGVSDFPRLSFSSPLTNTAKFPISPPFRSFPHPNPFLSPPPAPTWPSSTSSAAGSPATPRCTRSAASSSPPRYRRLLPPLSDHAVTQVLDSAACFFPAAQEVGRRPLSSAAGDAASELRGARDDVKQLLKTTSCHPILVWCFSSFKSRGSLLLEQTSDCVGLSLFIHLRYYLAVKEFCICTEVKFFSYLMPLVNNTASFCFG